MRAVDRTRRDGASGRRRPEAKKGARSKVETVLAARERAVLAREQAVERREKALAEHRAYTEALLLEANEQLVVAAVQAQTMAEAAEQIVAETLFKAENDFLTGLPNRALLTDRVAQSIALAQRHGKKVALMYLDVDNFKDINDSLGHLVGDRLLQSVAGRLQSCMRHSDTVSRHGGDEFVVLLSEVEAMQDADLMAKKLIKSIAEPHLIDGHELHVTLSIGISLYPDDGKDFEQVLTHADTALYRAKRSGRNNYQRFNPDMEARLIARQSL